MKGLTDKQLFDLAMPPYIDEALMTKAGYAKETAAYIVRAVNSHEELLDNLKQLVEFVNLECATHNTPALLLEQAERAIVKAEGK